MFQVDSWEKAADCERALRIIADLHVLLTAAGEAGPYVPVAHSYGGLIGRLYASTYPDDVSGLVLVDALSEGLKDAETPEQWAIQRKLIEPPCGRRACQRLRKQTGSLAGRRASAYLHVRSGA
jgi:pimeloyl-ACP methyl ester carboxylesterase